MARRKSFEEFLLKSGTMYIGNAIPTPKYRRPVPPPPPCITKETKYVLCDGCGNKIYLGSDVFVSEGYCGVYCSAKCYADSYATIKVLDEDEAENCMCNILDDNAIKNEKAKIHKEILELQNKLDELNKILDC